ncbi:MAG: helix-turn-helix domain-containing protein [Clostridia bacterium]|jgi:DNA-binding XRE family transcriptional regulator|nr:helix-turn-helix domain-containing protein [Clostridia bacterium]
MLRRKQEKAIEMLVSGRYTQVEIARELKITEQTICNWKKDKVFTDAYENAMKSSISSLAPKARRTMEKLLNSQSDNVRFQVAKDILDRSGFKPKEKIQTDFDTPLEITVDYGDTS